MGSEDREAVGYDHGYDGEMFYLGLALDPAYVEGLVEGCLERIGEDDPEGERPELPYRATGVRTPPCWRA
jgi:hypothetical protein